MTLLLSLALWASPASAQDCKTELAKSQAALESAASSLEQAAGSLEAIQAEVDDLDVEIDELDQDVDDAEHLLALIRQASLAAPDQPVGAWAPALACYFDEGACPTEGEPVIPVLPEPKALKKAGNKKALGK